MRRRHERQDLFNEKICIFAIAINDVYSERVPLAGFFLIFMLMAEIVHVTQEGLDNLRDELNKLIAQRPVISAQIAEARDKGDLSENAEYDAAREAQGLLELKISKLQEKLINAKVIDESKINTDVIQMLNKVTLKNLNKGTVVEYTIVGESEANFKEGKLAATTPIGKALMGHKKGDVVEVNVPAGLLKFEVLNISI